jgi:hypothetical protein
MSNLNNFNFNKLDLRLSNADYWDFFIANDDVFNVRGCSGATIGESNVIYYDFGNPAIYSSGALSADTIFSLTHWTGATNSGYTLNTVGLTGIDNGFITFNKQVGDTTNQTLLTALTGSSLTIPPQDFRMMMTRVTGMTGNNIYPMDVVVTTGMSQVDLWGGFYQGYYKLDGTNYELIPPRYNQAWSAEFLLKPSSLVSPYVGQTLNNLYPENSGIFFYLGTRAENKFWNTFEGLNTGCTSGCTSVLPCADIVTEFCTIPKESDITLNGPFNTPIPLNPPIVNIELITNQFLIYGRSEKKDGCVFCGGNHDELGSETICSYSGDGRVLVTHSQITTNKTNPFLIYGRAEDNGCGCNACRRESDGFGSDTICTFTGFTKDQTELDYNSDIIDNAFALRITEDGEIGYRLLKMTGGCESTSASTQYISGVTVEEQYSISGTVKYDEWSYIAVRFVMPYLDNCELKTFGKRKGNLMIYVNGRLVWVFKDVDEIINKRLNDSYLKQVGVPFNMSLGGGSQGLLESQTFDGQDPADLGLPIEKNFAGTFIGSISEFKFNIKDLLFCDIEYNYNRIKDKLDNGIIDTPHNIINGIYYGKHNQTSIDLLGINDLTFKQTNSAVDSYVTVVSNLNAYIFLLIPSSFAQPSDWKNSTVGCLQFSIPYISMPDIIVPDINGNNITYKVYRSFFRTNGNLDIWMCN